MDVPPLAQRWAMDVPLLSQHWLNVGSTLAHPSFLVLYLEATRFLYSTHADLGFLIMVY